MAHRGLRWLTRGLGGSQGASVAHTGLRWLTRDFGGSQVAYAWIWLMHSMHSIHKWLMHSKWLRVLYRFRDI